ncbi:molybdenum cofactor guanylyltransferase [Cryobacterium psychrophilum]|uniref:Molybdopterin-guanine dinucleotide biosynthesis protein n=1 Tax=Cryobacterium psychrophilum TaxID=41988 RepID=A0A4Y8KR33_9MICO|nr:NTP transferase domain-containing protein [Cryobacterium psychrophilum]TDW30537.1 molybdopterin-guanine dinucleotide biosynthesis protein A [Cryobacterium psychrophilum]TFD76297.1 molybdopterin-guanine dinucleotide biosynthesis protein [Cryobacterium psychrophilum]
MNDAPSVDLIVLAGGRGSRLGGAVKPAVEVAGRTLLSRVLDAREFVRHTVIVGPPAAHAAAGDAQALWALEDPPFGGPVAGISAGLDALDPSNPPDWFLLLACDLPWAADAARTLLATLADPTLSPAVEGLHLIDAEGHAQWLTAAYRNDALRPAMHRLGARARGASMRQLVGSLALHGILDHTGAATDVDTWQDVSESAARLTSATDSAGRTAE